MKFKSIYSVFVLASAIGLTACSDNKFEIGEAPVFDPVPGPAEIAVSVKPKAMWIDTEANIDRLKTKAQVDAELAKVKRYGMNMVYLDAKAGNGYAQYKSDFIPYCNVYGLKPVDRDYDDYLGYMLEKCEELEIDVVASVNALCWGWQNRNGNKQGYIFDHWDEWGDKVQVRSDEKNPEIVVPITDDLTQVGVMLDPVYPEVCDLVVKTCCELVAKYPKLKGISLDYLRYNNNDGGWYGLGKANMEGYAAYWNEEEPLRTEIVTASGGVGPKFAKWLEYRSAVITDLLTRIRKEVKTINPDCEIHLWASADWQSRYCVGQNWASKKYIPVGKNYTDTYNRTGFADQLDVFITGAYCENVWKKDNPTSAWSVENFVKSWDYFIKGDCRCYGSLAAYALDQKEMSDATFLCLAYTDGYMNFELSHVNNGNLWEATLEGINRYENLNNTEN